jgi:histidinol-phosphate phosphatase family protein
MQDYADWTLFLDRDGVINRRIPDAYINHWDDFRFARGAEIALRKLSQQFARLIIITNQQGIAKKIMTVAQLEQIHAQMLQVLQTQGVQIAAIYYCGDLKHKVNNCRKPAPAMGLQAKADFPTIDFQKSIMVGDSISDLQFGRNLGMQTVLITSKKEEVALWDLHQADWDEQFPSLSAWVDQSLKF